MCIKYIKDPRTIILCVVQSTIDLTTSDALKLALKYDKKSERTLYALTKVDLMDKQNNLRSILMNEEIHLKYGFVAIKNRSG